MNIFVRKINPDEYVVTIGKGRVTLSEADCKQLMLSLGEALSLRPVSRRVNGPELLKRINAVDGRSLQAFLRETTDKDMVVLLKYAQRHEKFCQRLYANMSQNRAKLCREDLAFHYGDNELPKDLLLESLQRLEELADSMERSGTFVLRSAAAQR